MAGSTLGALKTAARRIGLGPDEYAQHVEAGEKWCHGCGAWHLREAFGADRARSDGLAATCIAYRRAQYVPRERKPPRAGVVRCQRVPARDGDVTQARRTVNAHVEAGRWPHPNTRPCSDCGHVWVEGERRHEYDHHLGYTAEHHEHVGVVCTTCHHARDTRV